MQTRLYGFDNTFDELFDNVVCVSGSILDNRIYSIIVCPNSSLVRRLLKDVESFFHHFVVVINAGLGSRTPASTKEHDFKSCAIDHYANPAL